MLAAQLKYFQNMLSLGAGIGASMAMSGFILSEVRLQKPQDALLKQQIKEAMHSSPPPGPIAPTP